MKKTERLEQAKLGFRAATAQLREAVDMAEVNPRDAHGYARRASLHYVRWLDELCEATEDAERG